MMMTRVNGIAVIATVVNGKFETKVYDRMAVFFGADSAYDTYATDNEKGNYSKVIALNEAMRSVMERTMDIADTDFPFSN